jgi:molecular chaperone DnaK
MPRQPELPAALGPLTRRNGIPISHERFHQDVERLTTALERALTKTADLTAPRPVEPAKPAPAPIAPSVPRVITRAAGPVLGIDFGFSNLVAAVIKDGPPLVVQDSPGRRSTPAMIATSKQGLIMGLAAKKQAILHPAETATSVPGLLLGTEEVRLGAIRHSPIDLAARLLSDLRKTAEQFASAKFVRTVVTVSPRFTATNALEQACREANLPNYELVPEPIAVVRACLDEHHQDGEFMVCHMGGAASWVAAVSANAGELSARAHLATQQPAGADFDRRIIEWICADFQRTHRIDLSRDPMAMQRLVEAAERTKILLSGIEQTEINLAFLAADASGPKHLVTRLDRSQFNKLTQSVLAEFIAFCRNFASRHTPPGKISVIVSGGMMRSPAVFGAVGELFRQNPLMPVPPEEAAALGAVMMAAAGSGVSHTGASG